MDDCIQEVMLKSIHVPSITAVASIVTEKLIWMEKRNKVTWQWNIGHKWSSSELDLENILNKIHDCHFKNVTSRVVTRFSFDLAWCPKF